MLTEQKYRTSQQIVQKMLNEEKMILDLELAVKKEKFKMKNQTKLGLSHTDEINNRSQITTLPASELAPKNGSVFGSIFSKIRF